MRLNNRNQVQAQLMLRIPIRGYERCNANPVQLDSELRIPIRGYETKKKLAIGGDDGVTNPYKGL